LRAYGYAEINQTYGRTVKARSVAAAQRKSSSGKWRGWHDPWFTVGAKPIRPRTGL